MKQLNRLDFIGSFALERKLIEMPDLEGNVYVREMTAVERDRFELGAAVDGKVRARLCAMCICDEDNKRLFLDSDIEMLSELPQTMIDPAFDAAQQINRMTGQDTEQLEKNFVAAQSGNSHSD